MCLCVCVCVSDHVSKAVPAEITRKVLKARRQVEMPGRNNKIRIYCLVACTRWERLIQCQSVLPSCSFLHPPPPHPIASPLGRQIAGWCLERSSEKALQAWDPKPTLPPAPLFSHQFEVPMPTYLLPPQRLSPGDSSRFSHPPPTCPSATSPPPPVLDLSRRLRWLTKSKSQTFPLNYPPLALLLPGSTCTRLLRKVSVQSYPPSLPR